MPLKEELDAILEKYTLAPGETDTRNKLIAAGFVLLDKNGIIYNSGAGRMRLDESSGPSAPYSKDGSTLHAVASMTKIITSVCALQLVEAGRIGLHDDLASWLPELAALPILVSAEKGKEPVTKPNSKPITLWHLLTHTSGLGYDNGDLNLIRWSNAIGRPLQNFTFTIAGWTTPLLFPPGEGWVYGTGTDWAGILVQRLTGLTLGEYMSGHIFKPLGISSSTTMCPSKEDLANKLLDLPGRAGKASNSLVPDTLPFQPHARGVDSGGAGVFTTPADYGKFLGALLRDAARDPSSSSSSSSSAGGGKPELLERKTVDLLFTPQLTPSQRTALQTKTASFPLAYAAEFSPEALYEESAEAISHADWGLGGMIISDGYDVPQKRRAGTMDWSGLTGGHWWIDRETGIAAAMLTHILPTGEVVGPRLYDELERAVYKDLNSRSSSIRKSDDRSRL